MVISVQKRTYKKRSNTEEQPHIPLHYNNRRSTMPSKQRDILFFFSNSTASIASLSPNAEARPFASIIPETVLQNRVRVRRSRTRRFRQAFVGSVPTQNVQSPRYGRLARGEVLQSNSGTSVPTQYSLPPGCGRLAKGEHFSVFKKDHVEEATAVYNFLLSIEDYNDFKGHVQEFKKKLNEGLYMYAISVAWLHRDGTAGTQLPSPWEINPRRYFPNQVIAHARKTARTKAEATDGISETSGSKFVTGTVRDMEFKMSWWREDIGLNSHHLHWHQVYPYTGVNEKTADREGELFYYMHQQMLARYDADRLAVGLMRVEPFINWNRPIPEGYNPHLTAYYGTYQFAARPSNMYLADDWSDADNPLLMSKLEYNYHRLLDAINSGKFRAKDDTLVDVTIDNLGAAVEASISSPNAALYGSIHNNGHMLLASVSDPDRRYKSAYGIMSDIATAVRDPIFFRWHKFIDNLFVLHKLTLGPYTRKEMEIENLEVTSVFVKAQGSTEENVLTTYMKDRIIDISRDMFLDDDQDHTGRHLHVELTMNEVNHDKFEYKIFVSARQAMQAVIRIFMAPKFDEHGNRYALCTQRRLFIEMDKFVYKMTPGENIITRSSTESSVIKPEDLPYKELIKRVEDTEEKREEQFCKCGWPEHMLLPRGTGKGMQFDLFVMATDWNADKTTGHLGPGTSYCGLMNKMYPDKRSMGFPFDRKFDTETDDYKTIDNMVKKFSNMFSVPIFIKYN